MKDFYVWLCIGSIILATILNYWIVDDDQSWNSHGSSSGYVRTGSWHK
jgi:hypothetical protein